MSDYSELLIREKLKQRKINVTQNRVAVYRVFENCRTPLSISGIIKLSHAPLDRISVYRALRCFLGKNIVQVIPGSRGCSQYIFSGYYNHYLKSGKGKPGYFICSACRSFEIILLPFNLSHTLLKKYRVNKSYLVLEGLCANCKG